MISRQAILTAFEMMQADKKARIVTVFCNRFAEAVRITRWRGGAGIHAGTFLVTMGALFPEEKAHLSRARIKYGTDKAAAVVWIRK